MAVRNGVVMAREPRTLTEVLTARAAIAVRKNPRAKAGIMDMFRGLAIAGRVGEFIIRWTELSGKEKGPLTVARFIELSGDSPRTVYHRLGEFRRLFPDWGEKATPQPFADHYNAKAHKRETPADVDVRPVLARTAS
jgi:hypothetical protein